MKKIKDPIDFLLMIVPVILTLIAGILTGERGKRSYERRAEEMVDRRMKALEEKEIEE